MTAVRWCRAATVVALAVLAVGCRPPVGPLSDTADGLPVPEGWTQTSREDLTVLNGGCSIIAGPACPEVLAFFGVAADSRQQVYDDALTAATAAIDPHEVWHRDDHCDRDEPADGFVGSTECNFTAWGDDQLMQMRVSRPDHTGTLQVEMRVHYRGGLGPARD